MPWTPGEWASAVYPQQRPTRYTWAKKSWQGGGGGGAGLCLKGGGVPPPPQRPSYNTTRRHVRNPNTPPTRVSNRQLLPPNRFCSAPQPLCYRSEFASRAPSPSSKALGGGGGQRRPGRPTGFHRQRSEATTNKPTNESLGSNEASKANKSPPPPRVHRMPCPTDTSVRTVFFWGDLNELGTGFGCRID